MRDTSIARSGEDLFTARCAPLPFLWLSVWSRGYSIWGVGGVGPQKETYDVPIEAHTMDRQQKFWPSC